MATYNTYLPALESKSKSVATFDGVGDIVQLASYVSVPETESWYVEWYGTLEKDASDSHVILTNSSKFGPRTKVTTYQWNFRYETGSSSGSNPSSCDAIYGVLCKVRWEYDGSTEIKIYVDDAHVDTITGVFKLYADEVMGYGTHKTPGTLRYLKAGSSTSELLHLDFTDMLGKATATIPDQSGNSNDGTLTTTDLDAFWANRYEDVDGVLVDTQYNLITNLEDYVHNGCEVALKQDDTACELLSSIIVNVDGELTTVPLLGELNDKPKYEEDVVGLDFIVRWTGDNWRVSQIDGLGNSLHPSASGQYPSKTGWPDIGGLPLSIDFGSPWIADDGTLNTLYYEDFLALRNLSDDFAMRWVRIGDVCHLEQCVQYEQGAVDEMSVGEYKQVFKFAGDDCVKGFEILYDVSGYTLYDSDGQVIITQRED